MRTSRSLLTLRLQAVAIARIFSPRRFVALLPNFSRFFLIFLTDRTSHRDTIRYLKRKKKYQSKESSNTYSPNISESYFAMGARSTFCIFFFPLQFNSSVVNLYTIRFSYLILLKTERSHVHFLMTCGAVTLQRLVEDHQYSN